MNVLFDILNKLDSHLKLVPQKLRPYSENELTMKQSADKWSKKEILGHLCDSAVNNLSRFIRAQFEAEPFAVTGYSQNEWVEMNHYNEMKMHEIVNYWVTLNNRIIYVVSRIPQEKLGIECDMGNASFRTSGESKTLFWLIEDYLVHMEHHLKQLGIRD